MVKEDLFGNPTDFGYLLKSSKDIKTFMSVLQIYNDWKLARFHNKIPAKNYLVNLNLKQGTFWMNRQAASSSIDTFLEIFKLKNHCKIRGFQGENCEIVVDIGANEGFYSLFLKKRNPSLKIFCVEPIKSTFEILKKNILSNGLDDLVLENFAIGIKKGDISFEYVPEITVLSSKRIFRENLPWLDKERIKTQKVRVIPLSILINKWKLNKIDILKIDVEGGELEVLKSLGNKIKIVQKIVLEWHSVKLRDDCKKFLLKKGFKLLSEETSLKGDLYFCR